MSTTGPSEQEMQAAYEAELKRLRVEHVLLEQVVMLVNLGMRRTGLSPGAESERDPAQVQLAIESVRALLPLLERSAPEQLPAIRQALSQLQLAYVRIGGAAAGGADAGRGAGAAPGGTEPASGTATPAPGSPASGAPPPGSPAPDAGSQAPPAQPPRPGEPGPAERSGRLWVPGR